MITLIDEWIVQPGHAREARLHLDQLQPIMEQRGYTLVDRSVSAPVARLDAPTEFVVRWSLPSVAAFWAQRGATRTDPSLVDRWREIDRLCISRRRRFVVGEQDFPAAVPPAERQSPPSSSYRFVGVVHLRTGADDIGSFDVTEAALERAMRAALDGLPGVRGHRLGRHLPGTLQAGQLTWDVIFDDRAAYERARPRLLPYLVDPTPPIDHIEAVAVQPFASGVPDPRIRGGIKRTLLLRIRSDASEAAVAEFERDLLAMVPNTPAIINWSLARADESFGPSQFTHAWEQEFRTLEGLRVDYMHQPIHWACVDAWFDPEMPHHIVEPSLAHAFYAAPSTVLGL